jgi:LysM repeat protein
MDIIRGHKLEGDTIVIYLDENYTEFSSELGNSNGTNKNINEKISSYLKEKTPNIKANVIKVMVGGIIVSTIPFAGLFGGDSASAQSYSQAMYTVQSGDSLYKIAKDNDTSVNELKAINNLSSNVIQVGQKITLPSNTTQSTYSVKSGDSLSIIAKRFGTTTSQLKSVNGLSSDVIYIGQVLTIPGVQTSTSTYIVRSGDSLSVIAKNYGTTVEAIKSANNLTSNTIYVGKTLVIPSSSVQKASTSYKVISGDSLSVIAQKFGTTVTSIKAANNLSSNTIYVGQTLTIPNGTTGTVQEETSREATINNLLADTNNYLGVPYVWGGETPAGFDCSGFVYFMYNKHGVDMPRTTSGNLYQMGIPVSTSDLQPGDLVFFGVNQPGVVSHVGFYQGDGKFISATSSKGIYATDLDNSYWSKYYMGAKRLY